MSTMVLNPLAVRGILFYQRFISPYKGFRCAHRASKKGWSCSEFGRRVFARHDVATAYALLQRRFAQCKQSYAILSAGRFTAAMPGPSCPKDEPQRKKQQARNDIAGQCCNTCDVPSIDACNPPDIGACDCSL